MKQVTFYHAGCPVCVEAEQNILQLVDPAKYEVSIVHLGEQREYLDRAKNSGVKSVPALVYNDATYHINFGAAIEDV